MMHSRKEGRWSVGTHYYLSSRHCCNFEDNTVWHLWPKIERAIFKEGWESERDTSRRNQENVAAIHIFKMCAFRIVTYYIYLCWMEVSHTLYRISVLVLLDFMLYCEWNRDRMRCARAGSAAAAASWREKQTKMAAAGKRLTRAQGRADLIPPDKVCLLTLLHIFLDFV